MIGTRIMEIEEKLQDFVLFISIHAKRETMTIRDIRDDIDAWCAESTWWIRIPVLLLILHQSYRQIGDPSWDGLFSALDFGIHELGHVVFTPLGEFMTILGGSFWQLAAPIISAVMFLRQRDYFAISVCSMWLGISLYRMALYMEDARTMSLPLVSVGGGDAYHDWNYLFRTFHMLQWDFRIGYITRGAGGFLLLFAVVSGTWILWKMFNLRRV